jgi:hypothetical protein
LNGAAAAHVRVAFVSRGRKRRKVLVAVKIGVLTGGGGDVPGLNAFGKPIFLY